jgi:hypothetical protein
MDKKLEQMGLHDIRHMNEQECEETLLYLRYYLNRLSAGARQEGFQVLLQHLEARLQPPPGPGELLATGEQAPV